MRTTMQPMAAPSAFDLPTPPKKKGGSGGSAWIDHVRATQAANPGMSWKEAMVAGKATYQKGGAYYYTGKRRGQKGGMVFFTGAKKKT